MRSFLRILAGLAAGAALTCVPRAQEGDAPPVPLEQRASQAIADYEAVRADPKKRAQALKLLEWLGRIDHEAVTVYLQERLADAGVGAGAAPILNAIAAVPRPGLENEVWSVLHAEQAVPATQSAAAAALLRMGLRAEDRLLSMLRRGSGAAKEPVRVAAIRAVVATGEDRVIAELRYLFEGGTSDDDLRYIRLLEPVHGVAAISAARMKLIPRSSQLVAAIAWRQLAEEQNPRARDLVIDVLERMPQGAPPAVAAELVVGLAIVRDAELYPLLLRYGASSNGAVKKALRRAAKYVADDPALLRYLTQYGLEDDRPGARDAALALLREAPAGAVAPLVEKVRKALRRPRKDSLDLAIGLHDLLAKDPTWEDDVLRLAASPQPEVRTVGLSLLTEIGSDKAVVYAQRSLADKSWELRIAAIRYLTRFRDVGSIPLLIGRFGKEDGRIHAELANALFVHTGTRCFKRAEWDEWWQRSRDGFALPHEDTVRSGTGGLAGQTAAYHGIPLVSKRVAFLVDTSGSMGARVGTDRKRTRLDLAKSELRQVVGVIPEDFRINLIAYDGPVRPLWDELRVADRANREKVLEATQKLRPAGGTNIYGALEEAFRDREVDTIYLLTDGEPSAGVIVDPDDIADEVHRWNHLRQIVIHCIGLGIDSKLLQRLAEDSGGEYKFVQ